MSRLSMFARAFALASVLGVLGAAAPLAAQDPDPDDGTSMAFRPVDASEVEDVDGGALMVAAYGTIFILLLGYVLYLARIQAGTSAELARLRKAIETQRGYRDAPPVESAKAKDAAKDADA